MEDLKRRVVLLRMERPGIGVERMARILRTTQAKLRSLGVLDPKQQS